MRIISATSGADKRQVQKVWKHLGLLHSANSFRIDVILFVRILVMCMDTYTLGSFMPVRMASCDLNAVLIKILISEILCSRRYSMSGLSREEVIAFF